jgi:transcriptional regulator with XRE-family HTH domain
MIKMSEQQAQGRLLHAARILAGLDQQGLAVVAGVSAGTISNIEQGKKSTDDSIRAVKKALRQKGVNQTFGNNQAAASICFVDKNAETED